VKHPSPYDTLSERKAANGHGLEVQHRAIGSFAESQSYTLVDVVSDAGRNVRRVRKSDASEHEKS
jgi:hypothetical protein